MTVTVTVARQIASQIAGAPEPLIDKAPFPAGVPVNTPPSVELEAPADRLLDPPVEVQ